VPGTSLIPTGVLPGFFGKVPSLGDFVSKRLPSPFIESWDEWLQDGLNASRDELGDLWLDLYLHGPIWRFLLPAGVAGSAAWIGVLMPSMDRGGRHFPFTIAAPVDRADRPLRTLGNREAWFDAMEEIALSALDDRVDIDTLDLHLLTARFADATTPHSLTQPERDRIVWSVVGEAGDSCATLIHDLADRVGAMQFARNSFWTTLGSKYVKPTLLVCPGLPRARMFATLLDGDIERWI